MFMDIHEWLDIHMDCWLHIEGNARHFCFHSAFVDGNSHVHGREFEFFSVRLNRIEGLKRRMKSIISSTKCDTYVGENNRNHLGFVLWYMVDTHHNLEMRINRCSLFEVFTYWKEHRLDQHLRRSVDILKKYQR